MDMVIELSKGDKVYAPGEVIEGHLSLPNLPAETIVKIDLLWRTEGKGTEDSKVVEHLEFETRNLADPKIPFSFITPQGPLSCAGKLIRLRWEIVASLKRPSLKIVRPIIVSHIDQPIPLR